VKEPSPSSKSSALLHPDQGPIVVDVLVVGAGPSGLAVASELKRLGVGALLVDSAPESHSSWRNHYRRLHLHTDGRLSTLPGLAAPESWPTYPSRAAVVAYLDQYVARSSLKPRLNTRVLAVEPLAEAAPKGPRVLARIDGGLAIAAREVVIATGYNHEPVIPTWPGSDSFPGRVVHSSAYVDGSSFASQSILVVGAGNSAAEIAVDLWEHGATVGMSIRGPIHIVSRDVFGRSTQRMAIVMARLPARLADKLAAPLRRALVGDLRPWGITTPTVGPLERLETEGKVPLIDAGIVKLITQESVPVFPEISRVDGSDIWFVDGRRERFDAIVLGTGYRSGLSKIVGSWAGLLDGRGLPTIHGAEAAPGLWFCGFRNPSSGALRESGIEATRIAAGIAKKRAKRGQSVG